jgi:plasmid segregation protein ParM
MITTGVVAIDNGGHSTCIVTKNGQERFPSVKGLYGNRTLTDISGKYDYIVEYKDKKYVMGNLAKYDCKMPLQMHTDSKQNLFFDLSLLVSIHQFGYSNNYVVTSVPISMHKEDEKDGIISRLVGEHIVEVNGTRKKFVISDVKVAPETAVAFWINEPKGKTRFIDLGSRTIGYASTIFDGEVTRFIDSESGTFKGKGLEALSDDYDQQALADYICGRLISMWNEDDDVFLLGGGALDEKLTDSIRKYFPRTSVMDNPQMANATGMYLLGRIAYNLA